MNPPAPLFDGRPVVIVVAHPDDEVIGAGGRMPRMNLTGLVHVTDGAPRDLQDAHAAGCATAEEYARMRQDELSKALARAGITVRQRPLGFSDQEASLHLVDCTYELAEVFCRWRPAVVITHPYEGGHPDHDATAFAVRHAAGMCGVPLAVWEMTSYHGRDGALMAGEFLGPNAGIVTYRLSVAERARKRSMLECFATQQRMLCQFPVDQECFRPAPVYDFETPPQPGRLFYENFSWGMTGARWRELAAQAKLEMLELTAKPGVSL